MRKVILSILLAGAAATPAIAQDADGRWHRDDSATQSKDARAAARQEQREQRQQFHQEGIQSDRAQRFEVRQQQSSELPRGNWDRSRFGGQVNTAPQPVVEQQQQQAERPRRSFDGQGQEWQRRDQANDQQTQQWQRRQVTDGQRSWQRSGEQWQQRPVTDGQRTWQRSGQRSGEQWQQRATTDGQRSWQRSGQQWSQNNTRYSGTWSRDWRNDRHYDWRSYRNRHRSTFHIGVYFDPFGYSYRPFNIGYRLQPYYYQQQYWIDPGMYQLPYPPPGSMWVRYWDDALLVDTYSGEVIDVIRNFFW